MRSETLIVVTRIWQVSLRDSFSFVMHHTARVAGPWTSILYYTVIVIFGFAILNYFTAFYVLGTPPRALAYHPLGLSLQDWTEARIVRSMPTLWKSYAPQHP